MQVSIELVGAIFQLEEKYQGLSLWLLSPHVIRVLCLLPLLILGLSELKVAAAYGIAALMVFAIGGTKILKAASGNIELKGHGQPVKELKIGGLPSMSSVFFGAWPFRLATIFHLV